MGTSDSLKWFPTTLRCLDHSLYSDQVILSLGAGREVAQANPTDHTFRNELTTAPVQAKNLCRNRSISPR
jgi:hypothetical protein